MINNTHSLEQEAGLAGFDWSMLLFPIGSKIFGKKDDTAAQQQALIAAQQAAADAAAKKSKNNMLLIGGTLLALVTIGGVLVATKPKQKNEYPNY